ncbi:MAG: hypothetical protein RQ760_02585 [Sedimentisphaerales bacterium]|nr:hypothetical protein [Sedimentisphaerales bacterium]
MQKKRRAISITAYMDKTYDIRKIGGDKIALLGLFIVSLFLAHMIVVSKSAILLSEPIPLTDAGLSVSMPQGNGWKTERQWNLHENGFSLRSIFALGSRNPSAEARCHYVKTNETTNLQRLFEYKAFEVKGEIIKVEQIYNNTLTFDWALIANPKIPLIFIFGTAKLSHNRRLDIEVQQIMNDPEMAERVFKKIVKNLQFQDNQLLVSGTAVDNITKFPEQAEYTLRTNKILQ